MKKLVLIIAIIISFPMLAQDGYYGKNSNYTPNSTDPNIVFNFDYKMTGIMSSDGHRIPFIFYVNTADGSLGLTGGDLSYMIVSPTTNMDGESFDFGFMMPGKVIRSYYTYNDPEEGLKKIYITTNMTHPAPLAQLNFAREESFYQFLENASVTNAGRHPVFGPQKLYTGELNGKQMKVTIATRSARIKITPSRVGYLVGIFQDDRSRKNRFITKVEGKGFKIELHDFTYENFIFDATNYTEEALPPSTLSPQSMVDNETTIKEISERMKNITSQIRGAAMSGDTDRIQILALKNMIEGQRFNAIKTGHPERQISEADAGVLINLKARIIDKQKECERYAEMNDKESEAYCKRQLKRLEDQFNELYNRYLSSR